MVKSERGLEERYIECGHSVHCPAVLDFIIRRSEQYVGSMDTEALLWLSRWGGERSPAESRLIDL